MSSENSFTVKITLVPTKVFFPKPSKWTPPRQLEPLFIHTIQTQNCGCCALLFQLNKTKPSKLSTLTKKHRNLWHFLIHSKHWSIAWKGKGNWETASLTFLTLWSLSWLINISPRPSSRIFCGNNWGPQPKLTLEILEKLISNQIRCLSTATPIIADYVRIHSPSRALIRRSQIRN